MKKSQISDLRFRSELRSLNWNIAPVTPGMKSKDQKNGTGNQGGNFETDHPNRAPAIVPDIIVASDAARRALMPRRDRSLCRCGAIPPIPPI